MSLLRSVSVLTVIMLSIGSAVAFVKPNQLLPQATAQNTPAQPRFERGEAQFRELNLTPEQTQRIQTLQNQYREQISQRQPAIRQAQQELLDLMSGTASESQIRAKYQQVATLKQQVADIRFNNMLAMREVLTPEQRRQFAERMQTRQGKYRRDRNRGEQGMMPSGF